MVRGLGGCRSRDGTTHRLFVHGRDCIGRCAECAAIEAGTEHRSMSRRSKSSRQWLHEHFTDPFVKRAQAEGWRSRAVFKLEEIDRRERLLKPGQVCLDLGAAPGAWSQYARRKVGPKGRVVATDILEMTGITGVEFVQGDFREEEVFNRILALVP